MWVVIIKTKCCLYLCKYLSVCCCVDNPDEFSLLFLVDVSVGVQVKVTDKAWNGTSFVGGEGILGFTITQAVPAGTVINYYGTGMADAWGEWERIEVSNGLWRCHCLGVIYRRFTLFRVPLLCLHRGISLWCLLASRLIPRFSLL